MAGPARSTSLETQQIVYTVERLEKYFLIDGKPMAG